MSLPDSVEPVVIPPQGTQPPAGQLPAADGHRWISLVDAEADLWLFDVSFLLSGYNCIYGDGCLSVGEEPDTPDTFGCCIHGAHLADEEDLNNVAAYAALLDDSNWQYRKRALKKGGPFKKNSSGDWVTRKAEGACIFLNRDDFPGGAGCSLHRAALERGERPLDWKPDVCWQVPIHLDVHSDEYGHDTVFVSAWERRDWGGGGEDFNWWCIEEPVAYHAANPVYETCRDELVEMVGEEIYLRLADQLDQIRADGMSTPVTLGASRSGSSR